MLLKDFEKEFTQALAIREGVTVITFPACITGEDFDRLKAEIQAAVGQAELRGQRRALALILGEGNGIPVGIMGQPKELVQGEGVGFIQEFAKTLEFMNATFQVFAREFAADDDYQASLD